MLLTGGHLASHAYDCFIIGSGPAGLSLALALAEAKKTVLVFESGDETRARRELANSIGYGHYAGEYWNNHWSRVLGGTSNVWSGWCPTHGELDFDNPAVGVRWPVSRAELMPYYRRAAPILDHDPALIDLEKPVFQGFTYRPVPIAGPTRLAAKYGDLLKGSASIHVALGCSVVALDANARRSSITGLEYVHHESDVRGRLAVGPAQTAVLAAGGIGNPQLLLQPRADGSVPVGNEGGQAGKFLMEHPHFNTAGECVIDEQLERQWPVPGFTGRSVHAVIADRALALERGLYACHVQFRGRTTNHDMARFLSAENGRPFYYYGLNVRAEMLPSASNRVFLTGERDRSGLYRPGARCVLDARDFLNTEMTLRLLGESLLRLGKGRVRINNDRIYTQVMGGGHIMGATRMGTGASTSVVDRQCRVHGYENLFVAGSSVFPTGGFANPTLTIVALALRLAETVANRR
jgi:choline dehydrogenase-like flavoprotein